MTPITRLPAPPRRHTALPWLFAPQRFLSSAANHPFAPVFSHADPSRLQLVKTFEAHSIDYARLGSRNVPLAGGPSRLTFPRGTPLSIYGWAVDTGAHRPSSAVYATLDGVVLPARGNVVRDDVAAALGDPAYALAGFELDIATAGLPPGRRLLVFFGVNAAGTGRYAIGTPLALDVTAP